MIDEKTLHYLKDRDSVPECEVIEADSQRHTIAATVCKTNNIFMVLLFPANLTGLGHIAVFSICLSALSWVQFVTLHHIHYAVGFIDLIVTLEMMIYLYHCVRESATGAVSAPDSLTTGSPDMTGVSATLGGLNLLDVQYLSMIFPFLVCFLPTLLYPFFVDDVNWNLFWVMLAIGIFYFPMFFLAVVMFDSSSGYNPWLHIVSILCTFISYCVLVVQFAGVVVLIVLSGIFLSRNHTMFGLLTLPLTLYLIMVYMHLLGRFFYNNEEKLRWDV